MAPKLRKLEKDVLIPRLMEYKISHELCHDESKEFADCARESGPKVVINCRGVLKKYEECSNRWFRDENFRKETEQEYIDKRRKFRETGQAEKSPRVRM